MDPTDASGGVTSLSWIYDVDPFTSPRCTHIFLFYLMYFSVGNGTPTLTDTDLIPSSAPGTVDARPNHEARQLLDTVRTLEAEN